MSSRKEGSDSPSRKKSTGKGSDVFEHIINKTRKKGWCGFSRGNEAQKESLSSLGRAILCQMKEERIT